jgi:hypothetical protein
MAAKKKRTGKMYHGVIEALFLKYYKTGSKRVTFTRAQLDAVAKAVGEDPSNMPDVLYSFRYRRDLPQRIRDKAPTGMSWIIRGTGLGRYAFEAIPKDRASISPRAGLAETRVPDATPGVIARYALTQEQALLAIIRYNRLIDIFMGLACYSLQNHLRTSVPGIGQVETDEVYVGIDKQGTHYVIPIQAKGGSDKHNIVQIEQDFAMCRSKFPQAVCRAVAAQFMKSELIVMVAFGLQADGTAAIVDEKHYRLVPSDELTDEDLLRYRIESARAADSHN